MTTTATTVGQELGPSRGVQRDAAKWRHSNPTNPSTKLCCGRCKLQTPSIPTSPFSIAEGAHPALYLRSLLLRAGDVEVNPGPVGRGCTRTIRREITTITCSSCSQPYHGTCSGLTRNKKRTQGFICRPCAGLATPTITQAMGTNKQCCGCNTKMRLNSIAIRCHSCGGLSHRKCANVSRYAPHVNWCCHVCNHNNLTSNKNNNKNKNNNNNNNNNINNNNNNNNNHTFNKKKPKNTMCPACRGRLANYRAPLECSECKRGFHLKCAPQTRPALEHLRSTHSWTCQTCISAPNSGTTQQSNGAPQKPRNTLKRLTVMQWNCDYLTTKIPELRVVIKKYDIILLQETKLGLEDPTPLLEGFDAIRTDRKGSGTHTRRGGGLITYIKKGLQNSVPQCPAVIPLEQQCILLPTSSRRSISITNVYIPPESSTHTRDFSKLVASLPSAQGLICGDFNAHHPVWDDAARSEAWNSTVTMGGRQLQAGPQRWHSHSSFSQQPRSRLQLPGYHPGRC